MGGSKVSMKINSVGECKAKQGGLAERWEDCWRDHCRVSKGKASEVHAREVGLTTRAELMFRGARGGAGGEVRELVWAPTCTASGVRV